MRSPPADPNENEQDGFVHIGQVVNAVTKEIASRFELRTRLEAERGRSISDQEFLEIAEQDGLKI